MAENHLQRHVDVNHGGGSSNPGEVLVKEGMVVDYYFRSLPPGYWFCPKDEELIKIYLRRKTEFKILPPNRIPDVNIYNYHPEELTGMFKLIRETEWYFFTPLNRKYPNGRRPNRAAGNGYWRPSGPDKPIPAWDPLGFKKSLDYHEGKHPAGKRTKWKMHEYRLHDKFFPNYQRIDRNDLRLNDWVLCKIYKKANKKIDGDKVEIGDEEEDITDHEFVSSRQSHDSQSDNYDMILAENYPSVAPTFYTRIGRTCNSENSGSAAGKGFVYCNCRDSNAAMHLTSTASFSGLPSDVGAATNECLVYGSCLDSDAAICLPLMASFTGLPSDVTAATGEGLVNGSCGDLKAANCLASMASSPALPPYVGSSAIEEFSYSNFPGLNEANNSAFPLDVGRAACDRFAYSCYPNFNAANHLVSATSFSAFPVGSATTAGFAYSSNTQTSPANFVDARAYKTRKLYSYQ